LRRFLQKRFLVIGVLAIAGIAAFAGTCTIQHIALTTIGSNDVFAGEVHNDSGVNILQHDLLVAFLDSSNALLETKTVTPCLRTLPTGGVNYFSSTSTFPSATTATGLARVNFDSTFKVGTAAVGAGTITGLTVGRGTTTLTVAGTFKNTDATTLTSPNACAVVYNSSGNVIVVGLDESMNDLALNATDTFSITLTVPDSTATVDHVDVYVDGLKSGVPILPLKDTGNTVNLTPTATATAIATPGAAAKVGFKTQPPASTQYNIAMANIVVAVQDSAGTTTTSTANVTLAITTSTGTTGAALTCTSTLTVTAVAGLATFTGCQINKSGIGYSLTASSGILSVGVSNAFNITPGAATQVVILTQPGGGTGGTAWGTQPVFLIEDVASNIVWTDNTSTVTLAILANPGSGTLLCTTNTKTVVLGVATFAGCKIDKIGTGYTVTGTSGALTVATSGAFNIALGAASQVIITTQPSAAASSGVAFAQQPVFRLADAGGNTLTTDSASTITLTKNVVSGGPGTLACTSAGGLANVVTAGVTTFAGCNITTAGTYTITATSNAAGAPTITTTNIVIT
jgi:hypothetical protein